MKILQIVPTIGPGTGVGAVAHHLETEWRRLGVPTARFTLDDAAGSWLGEPGPGMRGKLVLALRVVWFSTVGTALARRVLRRHPDAVGVCHNDVLAGDVYVNHGILEVAMRSRGNYVLRMMRNPLHLFTWLRDRVRYTTGVHSTVVSLTGTESRSLRETYGRVRARTVVIPNGVDTQRFRPASTREQGEARSALGIPPDATLVLFVGHEYSRKGLHHLVAAARSRPQIHLAVVGGTTDMLDDLRREASSLVDERRLHLAGVVDDPVPWFRAADVFSLPSSYEANALVVLEAMACGLLVVVTPVGYVPDIVKDGENGYVVTADPGSVGEALDRFVETSPSDRARISEAARATAEAHDWSVVATRYLDLFEEILARRDAEAGT